jgi:hypothetical protein
VPTLSERARNLGLRAGLVWSGLAAAFLISVLLAVGLCTDACKGTYQWTIFGMPFPILGCGFFALCLALFFLRERKAMRVALALLIAGSWGAEVAFLHAQYAIIKRWCPMCLAVAFCVCLVGVTLAAGHVVARRRESGSGRESMLRQMSKAAFLAAVAVAGAFIAFYGMGNPAGSQASALPLALGKADSDIEVYVITDWFCPACRKAEPEMERAYPDILRRAKVLFIDHPVHPESMNFIPYNLSFLVREKAKYLEIRKALHQLSRRTKEPTPEDVQKAVAPLGVTYRALNYADVNAGILYFQSTVQAFRVEGTPAMVVYNRKTKTSKLLNGVRDLSYPNILMAVSGVAPP